MGSRTMDKPSQSGRTVARRILPKKVRKRQKRAVRKAAKSNARARSAKHPKQKRARSVAARQRTSVKPASAGGRKATLRTGVKTQTPAKPAKQRLGKPTLRVVPKAPLAPGKPFEEPRKKRAPDSAARTDDDASKETQQIVEWEHEPETDEPEDKSLDYLEDGVVEWGIRREEETGS